MSASEAVRSQAKSKERVLYERVQEKLERMPPKYRGKFARAIGGRSVKAAVQSYCAECVGWENVGNQVGHCTVPHCPINPWRPYQPSKRKGRPGRAIIRRFCLGCMGFETEAALSLAHTRQAGEDIRACSSALCPLHPYRPFQRRSPQLSDQHTAQELMEAPEMPVEVRKT